MKIPFYCNIYKVIDSRNKNEKKKKKKKGIARFIGKYLI